jgi:hypothetical protein
MRTLLLLLASSAVWIGSASSATQDALWRCMDQNGIEIFTNKPEALKDCQKYEVKAETSEVRPLSKHSDAEVKLKPNPVIPEERRAVEPAATGLIDFATVNRLALGMTEAEVLSMAGSPKSKLTGAWLYALADASIVEIRFGTGRIIEIRSHQLPQ